MNQSIQVMHPTGKNFMLTFESENKDETWAATRAVKEVFRMSGIRIFHQIQPIDWNIHDDPDCVVTPGFHGWEAWDTVTEDWMNTLAHEANNLAAIFMEQY